MDGHDDDDDGPPPHHHHDDYNKDTQRYDQNSRNFIIIGVTLQVLYATSMT